MYCSRTIRNTKAPYRDPPTPLATFGRLSFEVEGGELIQELLVDYYIVEDSPGTYNTSGNIGAGDVVDRVSSLSYL